MSNDWPVAAHDPKDRALDYYICDCEAHIMPEDYRRFIKYFPATATFEYAHKMCMHWVWTDHVTGKKFEHPGMDWTMEKIIADYDSAGVDQSCLM
ncbi:MAG: hypothetical protein QGG90_06505, partial [Nitrospinota bacterium]|nr:hypothetical protein [Nitrospinota bacterium]